MSTGLLERLAGYGSGDERGGRLTKLAAVGAALTVAPVRYLTERVTAPQVICSGHKCSAGDCCCKVYTAFCCQLTGGSNAGCPANTAIRGWWRCANYTGSGLCRTTGKRYYMDCSRTTGSCSCTCAGGSCARRHTCCSHTSYAQCRPGITGAVVCRLVTCVIPSSIPCTSCGATIIDNSATCGDEAPCLSGPQCCEAGHHCS